MMSISRRRAASSRRSLSGRRLDPETTSSTTRTSLPETAFQELSQLPQLHPDRVLMRCRDAGVEADARERADLAFEVAKTPSRESLFWPGFPDLLGVDFGMTAVVPEAQAPNNGRFIAAEAVPRVTPGRSHTDP